MPSKAPKSFNYDIIMPKQTTLENSPLKAPGSLSGYSSEGDRDHESTNYSSESKHCCMHSDDATNSKTIVVDGVVVSNVLASDNLNECVDSLL